MINTPCSKAPHRSLFPTAPRISAFLLALGWGCLSPVLGQDLTEKIESCRSKAVQLQRTLDRCRVQGEDITIPDASLAVAEMFLAFADLDASHPSRKNQTLRSLKMVIEILDTAQQETGEVLAGQKHFAKIPHWNVVGLQVRDGKIWSGDQPVFLSGFNWNADWARNQPRIMKRLGVNLVDGMLRGEMDETGQFDDQWYERREKPHLEKMERENFAVDVMLSINPPPWLLEKHSDLKSPGFGHYVRYAIDHPAYVQYRRKVLDHLVPLYAQHKSLFAIDLANEPAFQGTSAETFANWRRWLNQKYGSIEQVNDAWQTDFKDFSSIKRFPTQPKERTNEWQRAKVDWKLPGARGMHYDWCVFNHHRITHHFRIANDLIQQHAPGVNTHVKTMLGGHFTGGTEHRGWAMPISYHTYGIDLEAISTLCALNGGDDSFQDRAGIEESNRHFGHSPYVAGWLNSGLAADFLKSVAPEKPFYNSEFHVVEQVDATSNEIHPAQHMRLALWHAHLHGMNANLLWYLGRQPDGTISRTSQTWFDNSLLDQPQLLNAYARESLNLRRFVRPISSFADQARQVRILYSEASAIQDVHATDTLRDTYEAVNFLGVPIGMVTERQLAAGWLKGNIGKQTRLIIVPNASFVTDETVARLQQASKDGVVVRMIGLDSLKKTPVGKSRGIPRITESATIKVSNPQTYHQRIDQWIVQAKIDRDLLAVDAQGRPAWGIEVRSVHSDENRWAYLINLLRHPVEVTLQWKEGRVDFRHIETDEPIGDRVTLLPRQVVLGRVDIKSHRR